MQIKHFNIHRYKKWTPGSHTKIVPVWISQTRSLLSHPPDAILYNNKTFGLRWSRINTCILTANSAGSWWPQKSTDPGSFTFFHWIKLSIPIFTLTNSLSNLALFGSVWQHVTYELWPLYTLTCAPEVASW